MPEVIDPETMYVDDVPVVWWPVKADELTEEERLLEAIDQATGGLLWYAAPLEAVLRLLLGETGIQPAIEPPEGYDAERQGEWEKDETYFAFRREVHLEKAERGQERLEVVYRVGKGDYWRFDVQPERVVLERLERDWYSGGWVEQAAA